MTRVIATPVTTALSMETMSNIMQTMHAQYEKDMQWIHTIQEAVEDHALRVDVSHAAIKTVSGHVSDIKQEMDELKKRLEETRNTVETTDLETKKTIGENDTNLKNRIMENDTALKRMLSDNDAMTKQELSRNDSIMKANLAMTDGKVELLMVQAMLVQNQMELLATWTN